jgi:hypothetical protein
MSIWEQPGHGDDQANFLQYPESGSCMTPIGTTPEASAQYFKTELERYARIVKESGATVE